jgi:hypothetical protein
MQLEPQNIILRYVVDDTALQTNVRNLEKLTAEQQKQVVVADGLNKRWRDQQEALGKLVAEEAKLVQLRSKSQDSNELEGYTKGLEEVRKQMGNTQTGLGKLMSDLKSLPTQVKVAYGVEQLIAFAKASETTHAGMLSDVKAFVRERQSLETGVVQAQLQVERSAARELASLHSGTQENLRAEIGQTRIALGALQQVYGQLGDTARVISDAVIGQQLRQLDALQARNEEEIRLSEDKIRTLEEAETRATGTQRQQLSLQIAQLRQHVEQQTTEQQRLESRKKALQHDAAVLNKVLAVIQAGISTAVGVTNMLASPVPPPGNFVLAGLVAAMGAAQVAAIAATPLARGVIDLQGPGTSTSDSIPARLSRGESVLTAEETRLYRPLLWAMRRREMAPVGADGFTATEPRPHALRALGAAARRTAPAGLGEAQTGPVAGSLDHIADRILGGLQRLPIQQVSLTEDGLQRWVHTQYSREHYLDARF